MTAPYLQPGDKIHIAIPRPEGDLDAAQDRLERHYAMQGVEISYLSVCPVATYPTVVAVFRSKPAEKDRWGREKCSCAEPKRGAVFDGENFCAGCGKPSGHRYPEEWNLLPEKTRSKQ